MYNLVWCTGGDMLALMLGSVSHHYHKQTQLGMLYIIQTFQQNFQTDCNIVSTCPGVIAVSLSPCNSVQQRPTQNWWVTGKL